MFESGLDKVVRQYQKTNALTGKIAETLIKTLKENCPFGYSTKDFIAEIILELKKRESEWEIYEY